MTVLEAVIRMSGYENLRFDTMEYEEVLELKYRDAIERSKKIDDKYYVKYIEIGSVPKLTVHHPDSKDVLLDLG